MAAAWPLFACQSKTRETLMKINSASKYLNSLRELSPAIYYKGKRIKDVTVHPATAPHVRAAAMTYALAGDPEQTEGLATATSHLTGRTINRFTHICAERGGPHHEGEAPAGPRAEDGHLLPAVRGARRDERDLLRHPRDGLEARLRLPRALQGLARSDPGREQDGDGGDDRPQGRPVARSPVEQADPDQYVHVVERRPDGDRDRGAKIHQTGAVTLRNSDHARHRHGRAVEGLRRRLRRALRRPRRHHDLRASSQRRSAGQGERIDVGTPAFGAVGGEALIAFDNVFVPSARVFMDGQTEFTGPIVARFATHHRANYGGCKTGIIDVLVGAVSYLSQIQGTAKASHVRDKITEMIHLGETLYSSSIACSAEGKPTVSGAYVADTMLANVCKHNVTRFHFEVSRLALDLAGGFLATMPSQHDSERETWDARPEVPLRRGRRPDREPDQDWPADRGDDERHRHGGVDARSGISPGPAGDDSP